MAGQPPLSPWMGSRYYEPQFHTPRDEDHKRDLAYLKGDLTSIAWKEKADNNIRMINHWDNIDGTVERGYSGRSIFFENGEFRKDWQLIEEYAQLLSAVRINAISINNVNVRENARFFITNKFGALDNLKIINDIFAKYSIKTFIAINFAAPKIVASLTTSDPLDEQVIAFWRKYAQEIYEKIPDFGGFVVKADAEGEPGPLQYGRTHADGANMLANAVAGFGGLVFWRCFVYNHKQDWRDRSTDRAKAAYENFKPLDGQFLDNVILQIKNGPIDFQNKEPVSPLIFALTNTNQILEFQITQEYTGQQQHLYFLAPMWKEVIDFKTSKGTTVEVINKSSKNSNCGMVAVGNTGLDYNWCGNKLAQANLYAYGRLCWDTSLTSEQLAQEFVELAFPEISCDAKNKIMHMLVTSRQTYTNYTTPLGLGFMCRPGFHYSCDIDGYEYDRWGTYHFADRDGLGNNRTTNGTNFVSQYESEICKIYNNLDICPDEDLLFFHYVKYTHRLKSGKTVIQHIYDSHFEGVESAKEYLETWKSLEHEIDGITYLNVLQRFHEQVAEAEQWCDKVNTYFYRKSKIADEKMSPTRIIYA